MQSIKGKKNDKWQKEQQQQLVSVNETKKNKNKSFKMINDPTMKFYIFLLSATPRLLQLRMYVQQQQPQKKQKDFKGNAFFLSILHFFHALFVLKQWN